MFINNRTNRFFKKIHVVHCYLDEIHVTWHLCFQLQASEIPTVHVFNNESETAEGQVQNTAPSKYELCMLGENGKAQTGSRNRTVSVNTKRKGTSNNWLICGCVVKV